MCCLDFGNFNVSLNVNFNKEVSYNKDLKLKFNLSKK